MGRACLADSEYISQTRALIQQEREFLIRRLAAQPELFPFPSVVNYLLVKLTRPGMTAADLREQMLTRRIVIRDASNFRGLDERFFRIAVRGRQENERLLKALEQCLGKEPAAGGPG
jgi:threonine-phosphate decarboxylase